MRFAQKIRTVFSPDCGRPPERVSRNQPGEAHSSRRITRKLIVINSLIALLMLLPETGRAAVSAPSGVDTNPLNLDPAVRQAFDRFYILDYDGALSRFEKIQSQNPDNPLAVDYVLDTVLFRELYRLDLLDTTLYAHDGFLSGKHSVARDPAVAERVNSLFGKAVELSDQDRKSTRLNSSHSSPSRMPSSA